MTEKFKILKSFTFKKLDFDKLLELLNNYLQTKLTESEITNKIFVEEDHIQKSVSPEIAKAIFESGKFDMIHFFIQERWGTGNSLSVFVQHHPNRLAIHHENMKPDLGRKIVDDFISALQLIDIYDSRLLKVKNKSERSYMQEALVCRNSNAMRAAVIMGWTCVMHIIYSRIEKKYKRQFIDEVKKKNSKNAKFKLKPINQLEDYQQFKDREVLEISKALFLDKGLANRLLEFLNLRNDCAHVRRWKPNEITVDAFLNEIFNNFY